MGLHPISSDSSPTADKAEPLTRLLRKNMPWVWIIKEQRAFDDLKMALLNAFVLAHFDLAKLTPLHINPSGQGLGTVLVQQDGTKHVLSYASRRLADAKTWYHSFELKYLELVWAVQRFCPYLYGCQFTVATDNAALTCLQTKVHLTSKLARWAVLLQKYDYKVVHRSNSNYQDAEFLSRHAICDPPTNLDEDWPGH